MLQAFRLESRHDQSNAMSERKSEAVAAHDDEYLSVSRAGVSVDIVGYFNTDKGRKALERIGAEQDRLKAQMEQLIAKPAGA